MSEERISQLEQLVNALESRTVNMMQQLAVLEARVPLQLEMIIKSIEGLTNEIRNERSSQLAINADMLSRIGKLESRPLVEAEQERATRRQDREHLVRSAAAEVVRIAVLLAVSAMGYKLLFAH